jgi:hypothetical protein
VAISPLRPYQTYLQSVIRETDESALQASSHGLAEARLFPAKSRLFAVHLALRADSNYVANLSVGYGQTFL